MATLLEVVQQAQQELGLPVTNAVAGNVDPDTKQMFGLVNRLGKTLTSDFSWRKLTQVQQYITVSVSGIMVSATANSAAVTMPDTSFIQVGMSVQNEPFSVDTYVVSIDGPTQATFSQLASATGAYDTLFVQTKYPLPADFQHQLNMTHWDRNNHWQVLGPVTPQEWEYLHAGIIVVGPRLFYRLLGNDFQIFPLPAQSTSRIVFEYITKNWALGVDGVSKASCTQDTDEIIFSESMFVLGLKAFYKQAKGLDYSGDYQLYLSEVGKAKAQDQGAPVIRLNGPRGVQQFISWGNIPETGYGQ